MSGQFLQTATVAAQVTERLRSDIINKNIEPGSKITIKEISERYGVSNMPVREAFRTLEGEKLLEIIEGKGDGTYIQNGELSAINTRRQWIAFHSEPTGAIYVDKGAEEAILFKGSSLLPAGIHKIYGRFSKGDVVEVYGSNRLLGKGECEYSYEELKGVIGKRSRMGMQLTEVIHRDKWIKL